MFKNIPVVTRTLLIINIALFLLKLVLGNSGVSIDVILGSFYPGSFNFKFWQPLTHMFVHGNLSHILFNMFALYLFGAAVEYALGWKKFLILYFMAGLGAFFLFNVQNAYYISGLESAVRSLGLDPLILKEAMRLDIYGNPAINRVPNLPQILELCRYYVTPMVGASGAIYGVLVAFGLFYPNEKLVFVFLPVPVPAKYFIPGLIVLEFILGLFNFSWNPVAHFAHLGGAVVGGLLMLYWLRKYQSRF